MVIVGIFQHGCGISLDNFHTIKDFVDISEMFWFC